MVVIPFIIILFKINQILKTSAILSAYSSTQKPMASDVKDLEDLEYKILLVMVPYP